MNFKRFIFLSIFFSLLFSHAFTLFLERNSSDISIHVITAPEKVIAGEEVRFGINIKNNGPDIGHNIVLYYNIPQKLKNCYFSADGGNTWYNWCGELNIGDLKPDKVKFIILKCTVKLDADGKILNTFKVDCSDDSNLSNNVAKITNEVIPVADLNLKLECNNKIPKIGEEIILAIHLKNLSKTKSEGVYVNVSIPPHMFSIISVSQTHGIFNPDTKKWWIGNLNGKEKAELKIKLKVNMINAITLSAFVRAKTKDMDFSNNSSSFTLYKVFTNDFSVSVLPDREKISTCGKLYYHVFVRNIGEKTSGEKVTLTLKFPQDLEVLNFSTSQGSFNPDGKWEIGRLKKGELAKLDIYAKYHNSREYFVSANLDVDDDNLSNNTFTSVVNKNGNFSEIGVYEKINNKYMFLNRENFFIVKVYNLGESSSTDVYVNLSIPEHFEIVDFYTTEGDFNPCKLKWHIRNLEPFKEETLLLFVLPKNSGEYTNSVNLKFEGEDPYENDNFVSKFFKVIEGTNLRLKMNMLSKNSSGKDLILKITLKNMGFLSVEYADVKIIPKNIFTTIDFSGDGSFYKNIWQIGKIEVGEVKTIFLKIILNSKIRKNKIYSILNKSFPFDNYSGDNFSYVDIRN